MIRIVIVGKTRMGDGYCIGGLRLKGWSAYRLKAPNEAYSWPVGCGIDVGDVLNVKGWRPENVKNPHTEDLIVESYSKVGEYGDSLPRAIEANCQVVRKISDLFEQCIQPVGSDSLGILEECVPNFSTQFWTPKHDLIMRQASYDGKDKIYYDYSKYSIKYVGTAKPAKRITAGSLVRLSLAGWFSPSPGNQPEACYLQLSGWW